MILRFSINEFYWIVKGIIIKIKGVPYDSFLSSHAFTRVSPGWLVVRHVLRNKSEGNSEGGRDTSWEKVLETWMSMKGCLKDRILASPKASPMTPPIEVAGLWAKCAWTVIEALRSARTSTSFSLGWNGWKRVYLRRVGSVLHSRMTFRKKKKNHAFNTRSHLLRSFWSCCFAAAEEDECPFKQHREDHFWEMSHWDGVYSLKVVEKELAVIWGSGKKVFQKYTESHVEGSSRLHQRDWLKNTWPTCLARR